MGYQGAKIPAVTSLYQLRRAPIPHNFIVFKEIEMLSQLRTNTYRPTQGIIKITWVP